MLDLQYLDDEEPFDLDDYLVFKDLQNTNRLFVRAWDDFKEQTGRHLQIYPSNYSISMQQQQESIFNGYIGDFNVVCTADHEIQPNPDYFSKVLKPWRYLDRETSFKLYRYTHKLEGNGVKRIHWLHYIITNMPRRYPLAKLIEMIR